MPEVKHYDVSVTVDFQVSGSAPVGSVIDRITDGFLALPGLDVQDFQAGTYATVSRPRVTSVAAEEQ